VGQVEIEDVQAFLNYAIIDASASLVTIDEFLSEGESSLLNSLVNLMTSTVEQLNESMVAINAMISQYKIRQE
jgi:hypothetical protein